MGLKLTQINLLVFSIYIPRVSPNCAVLNCCFFGLVSLLLRFVAPPPRLPINWRSLSSKKDIHRASRLVAGIWLRNNWAMARTSKQNVETWEGGVQAWKQTDVRGITRMDGASSKNCSASRSRYKILGFATSFGVSYRGHGCLLISPAPVKVVLKGWLKIVIIKIE